MRLSPHVSKAQGGTGMFLQHLILTLHGPESMRAKHILTGLFTTAIACLFFIVVAELAVRLAYPLLSNYNLEMWRYAKDLKKPLPYADLPFHHHPDSEGDYYGVHIRTNARGFRGEDISSIPPENTMRLMLLGDSFTLGWGVPEDSTMASRLQRHFSSGREKVQVINMGVCNYNTVMETDLFHRSGLELDPRVVILFHFINDAEPVPSQRSRIGRKVLESSYFLAIVFDRAIRIRSLLTSEHDWHSYYKNLYSISNPGRDQNSQALRKLAATCGKRGIRLLVVSIPELHLLDPYPFPEVSSGLDALCNELNIPFLDLLPSLKAHSPQTLWVSKEDTHANSMANRIMAEAVYLRLCQLGLME
jgi:hypothetical protein